MKRRLVLFLFASHLAAMAAEDAKPAGANCGLISPPDSAGEVFVNGRTLRVFPRNPEVGGSYTGCQALFRANGDKWDLISLTEIKKGDPVRLWFEQPAMREKCTYKKGRIIEGNKNECTWPQDLLVKSMPEGCVVRVQKAMSEGGLRANRPKECHYD